MPKFFVLLDELFPLRLFAFVFFALVFVAVAAGFAFAQDATAPATCRFR